MGKAVSSIMDKLNDVQDRILPDAGFKYGEFCDFRSEIYIFLMKKPFLGGICDMKKDIFAKPPDNMTMSEMNAARSAFCHFLLEGFRPFILYQPPKLIPGTMSDFQITWENNMILWMVKSSPFRTIAEEDLDSYTYNPWYETRMKVILEIVRKILPLFEKYKTGEISETQYNAGLHVVMEENGR